MNDDYDLVSFDTVELAEFSPRGTPHDFYRRFECPPFGKAAATATPRPAASPRGIVTRLEKGARLIAERLAALQRNPEFRKRWSELAKNGPILDVPENARIMRARVIRAFFDLQAQKRLTQHATEAAAALAEALSARPRRGHGLLLLAVELGRRLERIEWVVAHRLAEFDRMYSYDKRQDQRHQAWQRTMKRVNQLAKAQVVACQWYAQQGSTFRLGLFATRPEARRVQRRDLLHPGKLTEAERSRTEQQWRDYFRQRMERELGHALAPFFVIVKFARPGGRKR